VHRRIPLTGFRSVPLALRTLLTLTIGLAGCAAMSQDVHQYYRQMALNFREAEEKTKVQIATRESEANLLLKAGEVHQYKKAQREVNRLKDWQEHCAHERERFEKAARKLEPTSDPGEKQDPGTEPAS
jgi:hypothetical protein